MNDKQSDTLQQYDAARLMIYDMIDQATSGIQDIDLIVSAFKMSANERKAPLHKSINALNKTLARLKSGEEDAQSIINTLGFSPDVARIIENPTQGLR